MYASIRRYEVSREIATDVARRSYAELRQRLSERPGFVAYEIVIADDSFASITVFDTWVSAEESNIIAADWIRRSVRARHPAEPQITAGEVFEGTGPGHAPFGRPEQMEWSDPREDLPPLRALLRRIAGRSGR